MKVRPWAARGDLRLTAHVVAGRYRLDDLIGRGGAAEVYEALDLRLRRPVAMKVFHPDGEAPTEERCADEGRLLALLRHPGWSPPTTAVWRTGGPIWSCSSCAGRR
ncbi:hypothetical protein ACFQ60_09910 [Streptomyces zhihengii]